MSACFQQSGILPRENDILKILQIDIANVSAQFFSINGWIPSGPGDLRGFSSFGNLVTSSTEH